jgi:hypothetical protein
MIRAEKVLGTRRVPVVGRVSRSGIGEQPKM